MTGTGKKRLSQGVSAYVRHWLPMHGSRKIQQEGISGGKSVLEAAVFSKLYLGRGEGGTGRNRQMAHHSHGWEVELLGSCSACLFSLKNMFLKIEKGTTSAVRGYFRTLVFVTDLMSLCHSKDLVPYKDLEEGKSSKIAHRLNWNSFRNILFEL